ncbi:MAG: hypothetical protein U0L74_00605, partial [Paludibacteraceae bacterium]|nr:hypothetical protein [Paludibacteraceae bacterium]
MKTLKKIKGFLSMALALAGFSGASAQILISGTDFNVNAAVQTEMATGIENIVYTGVMKGEITLGVGFAEDLDYEFNARKEPVSSHFHETPQYGITNNPIKLDSLDYLDDEVVGSEGDWSIVFSPARIKANKTMLQYKVGGLKANSTATVVIEYRSVVDPKLNKTCANGGRFEFKVAINADQANLLQGKDVKQIETGTSASYTDSKVAVGADGTVDIRINAVPHMSDDCHAFAISKIEVYGDLDPEIYSVDGNSVCAGEIANLKIKGTTYLGVDYQWYRDDSPIAGATSPNYSFETDPQPDEHKYKLEIICSEKTVAGTIKKTSFFSNDVTIETEKCCEIVVDGVSVPASRKVVFKDDFGEFDIANDPDGGTYKVWDYSDIANPKQLTKKTIYPFRYELDEAPLNCKFNGAAGPISDGEYCVAGVLTGYNGPYNGMVGANLQWAADLHGIKLDKGFHTDHSGTPEGCCLLINCKDQTGGQNIYERDITNLCQNRQLFFECYITIFTSSAAGVYNPVDVTVRLTEIGNETNFIEKRATQTLPKPVGNGTGDWVKISGEIFLEKNDAVKLEIVNNQNTDQNGNDLVLDDIIIKACAAPSLQAYYDVQTFDTDTLTCGGEGITVYAKPSEMLSNYFGGADKTRFLYQYSLTPDVKTSWKNCGDVTKELSKDVSGCSVFSEVEDGDVVYFRIIAGSEYTLGNTKESDYNADDPCASYTISEAIPCEINCPVCSEPADPVISAEGGMVNKAKKTVELCKGESTVLTTNDITGVDKNGDPYADYTITWHKETATSAALGKASPAVVAPELTIAWDDVTEDGVMYIVKVHDIFENEKGTTGCDKLDTIVVIANPVPEKTLDEVEPFCEGTLAANEAPTLTIDGYKLHWYEDADTAKATKEPSVIDKKADEYEYFYVLEDSKTGCKGEVNPFLFTVNAVPEELEAPDTIEYVKGVASVDISEKAGVEPAEGNTLFWTESSAEGDDGSKTAPMHDITVEDKVGKKYYVYQKNEKTGCFGPKSEIVVIVNDSPKPTPKDTVVCVGKAIADLSSLVKKESKDYELLWYASASDAKEDGVTTPASLTEEQAATPGEYKFYVAQKNTVTKAISEKAVVTVTVVGVDKPKVEDIDYCTGDDAAPLNENVTLVADESKFTFQSGLEWFVNKNAVKDEPVVETNVLNTTPVRYAVRQVYEIPSTGEICQGDTAGFTVKTTFIGLPAVNATVTYVSGDLVGNTFEKNLLQQKEGAVETIDESYSLVWYDAEKNKIGDGKTPPTPVSDPAMVEAGKDQTFTYYVKQT